MPKFECQHIEAGPDDWDEYETLSANLAAEMHAATMDHDSGGEWFQDPIKDTVLIRVRHRAAEPMVFEISFDYSKDFFSREVATDAGGALLKAYK